MKVCWKQDTYVASERLPTESAFSYKWRKSNFAVETRGRRRLNWVIDADVPATGTNGHRRPAPQREALGRTRQKCSGQKHPTGVQRRGNKHTQMEGRSTKQLLCTSHKTSRSGKTMAEELFCYSKGDKGQDKGDKGQRQVNATCDPGLSSGRGEAHGRDGHC